MRPRTITALVTILMFILLVTFQISGAAVLSAITSSYRGDINEDGKIDVFDLLELLKSLAGQTNTVRKCQIADVNASGGVDVFDLLGLLKVLSGTEQPGVIHWGPAITRLSPSSAAAGDTLAAYLENIDESVTLTDIKALIDGKNIEILYFTRDSVRVIIPSGFTGGELSFVVVNDTTNLIYCNLQVRGITFVSIPGGTFQMGSTVWNSYEQPVHKVSVSSFQMGCYEVTQKQYQTVVNSNPSFFTGDLNKPVEMVSWNDAVTFCNKLSQVAGLQPCYNLTTWACDFTKNGFRLPTEAEWEYACRAGTTTDYYTGYLDDLEQAGWYGDNSGRTTHAVGGKQANAFELYDMHGNVCEWCNDWYGDYGSENVTNPQGPPIGDRRVGRGGCWNDNGVFVPCRSSSRYSDLPNNRYNYMGFRVVRR